MKSGRLPENARILVVKFNAIGDLVMITPALRDLREAYPKAHITLLVGSWSAPIIRKNPNLDATIEFDQEIFLRRRWKDIFRLLLELRRGYFDCAIILHAMLPIHLLVRLAGIPLRFGMARKGRDLFLTKSVPEELDPNLYYALKYQEVAALAGARPGPPDPEVHADAADEREAHRLLAEASLAGREFLLVVPGGGRNPVTDMPAKRWPKESFAEVIRDLLRKRPGLRIALAGSMSDAEETGFLAEEIPGAVDLTGKFTLPQLVCVVRAAKAVLCNDSSVLHIGVACGVPVVVPFGPTSAKQLVPERARPHVRQGAVACSPCYRVGSGTAFAGCGIGFQCLRETGTAEIGPLLERALVSSRGSGGNPSAFA